MRTHDTFIRRMREGAKHATAGASTVLAMALMPAPASAQPVTNWVGFYGVAFGEYAKGTSTQNDNGFVTPVAGGGGGGGGGMGGFCGPGETFIGFFPGTMTPVCEQNSGSDGKYRLSGGFGGGGVGYNFQFNSIVAGLEGAIGGGRASGASDTCGTTPHRCGTIVSAVSDLRGRVGYAFGPFLPYVTGGAAIDYLGAYDSLAGVHGADWRAGYTIGAGIEYKLSPRLSVRAEYLHTEIRPTRLFDIAPGVPERIGLRTDAARVSLVFFPFPPEPAPVVAKY